MKNKVLVLGCNGMLGGSIFRYFSENKEYETIGALRSKSLQNKFSRYGFNNTVLINDVHKNFDIDKVLKKYRPDIVFNCIGIIKQLNDSKLSIPSIQINSLLPHKIAYLCDEIKAKLVHFSTDCVFSGNKGMYKETDVPCAFDTYGRSKLLGEVNYGRHLTIRTSIIGHEIDRNLSLIDWFINEKKPVKGFSRAIFSGMPTIYVAELLESSILKSNICGLYHLGVKPINKFELLKKIKKVYELDIAIKKCSELKINRSLNSDLLWNRLGFEPPSWDNLLEIMRNEYKKYFAI